MSKLSVILDDATMPSGEFGATETGDDTRGVLQFTNDSRVSGKLEVFGSNDGKNFGPVKRVRLAAGRTKVVKVKASQNLLFFNRGPAFGPVTLILKS